MYIHIYIYIYIIYIYIHIYVCIIIYIYIYTHCDHGTEDHPHRGDGQGSVQSSTHDRPSQAVVGTLAERMGWPAWPGEPSAALESFLLQGVFPCQGKGCSRKQRSRHWTLCSSPGFGTYLILGMSEFWRDSKQASQNRFSFDCGTACFTPAMTVLLIIVNLNIQEANTHSDRANTTKSQQHSATFSN